MENNKQEGSPRLEGTLAIIKPDAFSRRIEIEETIMKEGFLLVDKKRLKFTKELAEEFYDELTPNLTDLIANLQIEIQVEGKLISYDHDTQNTYL